LIERAKVVDIADKGMAVAKSTEGKVFMVEGLVPGDVADLRVIKKRKGVFLAAVDKIVEYSEDRVEPRCIHFGVCGGCKWQHMSYEAQLRFKQATVENAIRRIGKIDVPEIHQIMGVEDKYYYRNKMEFSFSNKRWITQEEVDTQAIIEQPQGLGFHRAGAFDKVVDIHTCHLQDMLADAVRNGVREFALENDFTFFDLRAQKGLLRNLIIRNTQTEEWMVVVVFFEPKEKQILALMEHLKNMFPFINSLQYIINQKKNDTIYDQDVITYHGKDHIIEQLGDVKYKISAKSFFQTNSAQAENLYNVVAEYAELSGTENVYDLYTGTGSIALYLASKAAHVTGIEEVAAAVEDANVNKSLNQLENTTFYTGDVKDVLATEFIERHKPET
jgi:23S rRNA (uracil1939-C5)-methyltransferase